MKGKVIRLENKLAVVELMDTLKVIKCNLKGKFKLEKTNVLVGDYVEVTLDNTQVGIIEKVYPRQNSLIRPAVANIDQIILVFSISNPKLNYEILDTFLSVIENKEIDLYLCISKIDLDEKEANELKKKYEKVGYNVILTSTVKQKGIKEIKKIIKNKTTALAGPSGVGKSSLLNEIFNECIAEVGDLSSKIQRGKNTTKAVELLTLKDGGYILDTPGFTTIDLLDIKDDELEYTFREFKPFLGKCKFTGCSHIAEPGCEVKKALDKGKILKDRYDMYVNFYNKLKERANVREKSNKNYKGKKTFITNKESNKRYN